MKEQSEALKRKTTDVQAAVQAEARKRRQEIAKQTLDASDPTAKGSSINAHRQQQANAPFLQVPGREAANEKPQTASKHSTRATGGDHYHGMGDAADESLYNRIDPREPPPLEDAQITQFHANSNKRITSMIQDSVMKR